MSDHLLLGTALQGLAIGLAIAAPVGPIGVLCIRRTLQSGVLAGLMSGLGAACADAFYGFVVAADLALTGWLVIHARWVGGVGALLLFWMAVGALRSFRQSRQIDLDTAPVGADLLRKPLSPGAAFASTLALTLANPSTVLSFIAVVASLGGTAAGQAQSSAYVLVAGVFVGSLLWWCFLVSAVHRLGRRLPVASFRWLDLITGLVLMGFALWVGTGLLKS